MHLRTHIFRTLGALTIFIGGVGIAYAQHLVGDIHYGQPLEDVVRIYDRMRSDPLVPPGRLSVLYTYFAFESQTGAKAPLVQMTVLLRDGLVLHVSIESLPIFRAGRSRQLIAEDESRIDVVSMLLERRISEEAAAPIRKVTSADGKVVCYRTSDDVFVVKEVGTEASSGITHDFRITYYSLKDSTETFNVEGVWGQRELYRFALPTPECSRKIDR